MFQRKYLKIAALVLACLMCWGLVSCNTPETPEPETPETETPSDPETPNDPPAEDTKKVVTATYNLLAVTDQLKIYGRSSRTEDGISCDFTASGIEFSAYMVNEVKLNLSCTADTYFSVYVDGVKMQERYLIKPEDSAITLANFEEGGEHTIRILKQTEARHSLSVLKSLEMTGYWLDAPKDNPYYIEFIGDSISCGWGNLATGSITDVAQYADGTQAFAYLTAEKLGTDFSVIGCGGIGILTTGYVPVVEADFYTKQSYYRSATETYTPTRIPDVVVINLGTNDQNYNVNGTQFKQKVTELINLVRQTYGTNVPIVWCYNMMSEGMIAEAQQAIAGMSNVYVCQLTRNRNGGSGHPDIAGHQTAAEELTAFIQSKGLLG